MKTMRLLLGLALWVSLAADTVGQGIAIRSINGKGTNFNGFGTNTLLGSIQLGDAGATATTESSNTFRFRQPAHAHSSFLLQALTGDRALYIGPGKDVATSAGVTGAELEFLDGVTSSIQAQIDAIVGGAPGGVGGNLQVNMGGAFVGSTNIYADVTNGLLSIGSPLFRTNLSVHGSGYTAVSVSSDAGLGATNQMDILGFRSSSGSQVFTLYGSIDAFQMGTNSFFPSVDRKTDLGSTTRYWEDSYILNGNFGSLSVTGASTFSGLTTLSGGFSIPPKPGSATINVTTNQVFYFTVAVDTNITIAGLSSNYVAVLVFTQPSGGGQTVSIAGVGELFGVNTNAGARTFVTVDGFGGTTNASTETPGVYLTSYLAKGDILASDGTNFVKLNLGNGKIAMGTNANHVGGVAAVDMPGDVSGNTFYTYSTSDFVATNSTANSNLTVNFATGTREIYLTNNISLTNYTGMQVGKNGSVKWRLLPQSINRSVVWPAVGNSFGMRFGTNAGSPLWTTLTNNTEYWVSWDSWNTNIVATITAFSFQ